MIVTQELIARVLTAFLTIAQNEVDRFDQIDVQRVKTSKWSIERFALVSQTESETLQSLVAAMEWRKSYGVNDFTDEMFQDLEPKSQIIVNIIFFSQC